MQEDINIGQIENSQDISKWSEITTLLGEAGSFLAHKVVQEVSDELKFFPELFQQINEVCKEITPDWVNIGEPENKALLNNPTDNYASNVDIAHKAIDSFFKTDDAQYFTKTDDNSAQEKSPLQPDISYGYIPYPFGTGSLKKAQEAQKNLNTVKVLKKEASVAEEISLTERRLNTINKTEQMESKIAGTFEKSLDKGNEYGKVFIKTPEMLYPMEIECSERVPLIIANNSKGWKVGEPINNLTKSGNVPKWDTIRKRHWKTEAHLNPERFDTIENLERSKKGLAPQRIIVDTIESKELHHMPPQREGGKFNFIEVWPEEHAQIDPFRQIGE